MRAPSDSEGVAGCISSWSAAAPPALRSTFPRARSPRSPRSFDQTPPQIFSPAVTPTPAPFDNQVCGARDAAPQSQSDCPSQTNDMTSQGRLAATALPEPLIPARRTWTPLDWDSLSTSAEQGGWDKDLLGSRKQRLPSPGGSGTLATCLSGGEKVPPRKACISDQRAKSPRLERHEVFAASTSASAERPASPPCREPCRKGGRASPHHALHAADQVPLPPFTDQKLPHARLARPHRPDEEYDIDAYRTIRCSPQYYARSSSPGRNGQQIALTNVANGFRFVSQGSFSWSGLHMGEKDHVPASALPQLEEQGFLTEKQAGEVSGVESPRVSSQSYLGGPQNFPRNGWLEVAPERRHVPVPGAPPTEKTMDGNSLSELALDDDSSSHVPAAGVASPCYERGHGVIPRSAEDGVFRTESKLGSRRVGFGSQTSTSGGCTPSSASRDLAKGLSPERTLLCLEAFLGGRKRRSGSPWASPGSSPWASPLNSPRNAGTPPHPGGRDPRGTAGATSALPSWSAVAAFPDASVVPEGVEHIPVPTWNERPTAEKLAAAVTLNRPGSPVSVATPVVGSAAIESKYRGRQINAQKVAQSTSKGRWRA